jgi:hypothetical protein
MKGEKESFGEPVQTMSSVSHRLGISIGTHNVLLQILRIIPHAVQVGLRLSVCESDGNFSETECHMLKKCIRVVCDLPGRFFGRVTGAWIMSATTEIGNCSNRTRTSFIHA